MHFEVLLIFGQQFQLLSRMKKMELLLLLLLLLLFLSFCILLIIHSRYCYVRCTLTVSSPFFAPYTKECFHSWELQMSRLCVHDALLICKTISSIAIARIRSNLLTSMDYYPSAIFEFYADRSGPRLADIY